MKKSFSGTPYFILNKEAALLTFTVDMFKHISGHKIKK